MATFDVDDLLNIRNPPNKAVLEEYLEGIADIEFQERCKSLFNPYRDIILNINSMYGVMPWDASPEIFIHIDSDLDPQTAFGGIIEMGDAFIKQCLELDVPNFKDVVNEYLDDLNVEELCSMVSMMWIYSHEYFHYVRRHEDVKNRLAEMELHDFDEKLTDYAIERDADLCAVAIVFRYLQHIHYGLMPDLMIRKLTLYLLFWWLRPRLTLEHGRRHLSWATRLYNLVSKLSIITELNSSTEIVDRDFKEDATKEIFDEIMGCLVSCERIYRERYDQNDGEAGLRVFFETIMDNRLYFEAVARWDAMRPLIREFSGTNA